MPLSLFFFFERTVIMTKRLLTVAVMSSPYYMCGFANANANTELYWPLLRGERAQKKTEVQVERGAQIESYKNTEMLIFWFSGISVSKLQIESRNTAAATPARPLRLIFCSHGRAKEHILHRRHLPNVPLVERLIE